jgi:hypothetical protein
MSMLCLNIFANVEVSEINVADVGAVPTTSTNITWWLM